MQGVFLIHDLSFPWGDILANAALAGAAVVLFLFAYVGGSGEWLMIALFLWLLSVIYFVIVARLVRQFIRGFLIARRIARNECEDG